MCTYMLVPSEVRRGYWMSSVWWCYRQLWAALLGCWEPNLFQVLWKSSKQQLITLSTHTPVWESLTVQSGLVLNSPCSPWLPIFLPQPPELWDYRCIPLCQASYNPRWLQTTVYVLKAGLDLILLFPSPVCWNHSHVFTVTVRLKGAIFNDDMTCWEQGSGVVWWAMFGFLFHTLLTF